MQDKSKDFHLGNLSRLQELSLEFPSQMRRSKLARFKPYGRELNRLLLSYIPKDGDEFENRKKFSFLSEVLTIKKSLHNANKILSLNLVFAALLYFKVNLTSRSRLFMLGTCILGSNMLLHVLIENRFAMVLNEVLSEDLRYTIYKVQSGSQAPDELSKARKEIARGLIARGKADSNPRKAESPGKQNIVDFLVDGFYAPVDEKLENRLYFADRQKHSRQSFLDLIGWKFTDTQDSKAIGVRLNKNNSKESNI